MTRLKNLASLAKEKAKIANIDLDNETDERPEEETLPSDENKEPSATARQKKTKRPQEKIDSSDSDSSSDSEAEDSDQEIETTLLEKRFQSVAAANRSILTTVEKHLLSAATLVSSIDRDGGDCLSNYGQQAKDMAREISQLIKEPALEKSKENKPILKEEKKELKQIKACLNYLFEEYCYTQLGLFGASIGGLMKDAPFIEKLLKEKIRNKINGQIRQQLKVHKGLANTTISNAVKWKPKNKFVKRPYPSQGPSNGPNQFRKNYQNKRYRKTD